MKAVSPPAARKKLCVASSAHRHTRAPDDKTHTARGAEANTRDNLEEPCLQPVSGSAPDLEPYCARAAMFTFTNQKNGVKNEVLLMGLTSVEEVRDGSAASLQ